MGPNLQAQINDYIFGSQKTLIFIFKVFNILKNNRCTANLTQSSEKAAFKLPADETLSEAEAWGLS